MALTDELTRQQGGEILIYCEFKRALSLLNTSIISDRLTNKFENNVTIIVEENLITIREKGKVLCCDFVEAKLSPLTCRGLKYFPNGELQFTIYVDSEVNQEMYHMDTNHSKQSDFVEKIQLYQDKCYCAKCGQKIFADHCIFMRVLALPSENWADYSDMWFCHNHEGEENNVTPHQGKLLLPKEKQCLVGDTYLLVQGRHLKPGHTRTTGDALHCQRCGNQLGGKIHEGSGHGEVGLCRTYPVYKIFRHSVLFHRLEETIDRGPKFEVMTEDYFANLIVEQSHLYTSFRLVIEANKGEHTVTCLVWLIDPCLMVYIDRCSLDESRIQLRPTKVLKMLYKCQIQPGGCPPSPDHTFSSWKTDQAVHSIQLPYPMCVQLVSLLVQSSKCVPRSQRFLNKFFVGFLRYADKGG
ncbi:E3 ubiquitin-protein ligase E3D-like [Pecten maximus]|uniref:E3 ubiquitin-protein ligase E3D-like n=1 Tax=Pecten maximus TaxID=6579 RepID=UPI0014590FA3|nr:E3 ubiquitin-protein ligase E3D-like [Pecten maximus]